MTYINAEIEGQTSLFHQIEKSEEEKIVEKILLDGTGFVDGKKRVYKIINSDLTKIEKAKAIAGEFGTGGRCRMEYMLDYDSKGFRFKFEKTRSKKTLTWSEVTNKIDQLIQEGTYLQGVDISDLC